MSPFFINTADGRVATRSQLAEAGCVDDTGLPVAPWHPIRGGSDDSTLWYAVMRRRERGIFIGSLCVRHQDHHTLLLSRGWEEVPVAEIGC